MMLLAQTGENTTAKAKQATLQNLGYGVPQESSCSNKNKFQLILLYHLHFSYDENYLGPL